MATEETGSTAPGFCLRCKGEMVEGWIADAMEGQQRWIPGALNLNFLGYNKMPSAEKRLRVFTYRCVRCGYLESYANPEINP